MLLHSGSVKRMLPTAIRPPSACCAGFAAGEWTAIAVEWGNKRCRVQQAVGVRGAASALATSCAVQAAVALFIGEDGGDSMSEADDECALRAGACRRAQSGVAYCASRAASAPAGCGPGAAPPARPEAGASGGGSRGHLKRSLQRRPATLHHTTGEEEGQLELRATRSPR